MSSPYVTLLPSRSVPGSLAARAEQAEVTDVDGALALGIELGRTAVPPGEGSTRDLWEAMATLASRDLGAARAIEPHLDALAILSSSGIRIEGVDPAAVTWGVFAAEGGDDPLSATLIDGRWSLTGTKPWCSLADRLDYALVTSHLAGGERGLFAVDLRSTGVSVSRGTWHARGLAEIPSGPVVFLDATAVEIGEPGWYLKRPGFAWGGIGVAACWYGGAVGVARAVFDRARPSTDPLLAMHLGAIDEQLQSARRALAEAAELVDAGFGEPSLLAKRVRATVAKASETVLWRTGHALGPSPLALDESHAKRVADLELYIRQHHAEKDEASLGLALVGKDGSPW